MTQSSLVEDTLKKWSSLINNSDNNLLENTSLLPMSKKIVAKTIGLDLVEVKPIGGNSQEEIDRLKAEIKAENREGKIESILDNKNFKEKTIKDHPKYKSGGSNVELLYFDFVYDNTPKYKKTRRSGKNTKKNTK